MHVLRIDQRAALARTHGKWLAAATHYRWHARSYKGCGREDDTRHTTQDIQHGTKDPRHMKTHCSKDSATGTRTRVARVRAEYPNQLDYSGVRTYTPALQYPACHRIPCFTIPAFAAATTVVVAAVVLVLAVVVVAVVIVVMAIVAQAIVMAVVMGVVVVILWRC